ncbi:hypothetical protein [Pseudonocardia endophytica]|uniref:Uncharacterized protein n=1 Tax=Pseudonocardia endophytica TaxID=401976 RepID=A0A4R1HII3_PSEEN|nr:hypothetical protein [Pseudonocardia endophytica]TCK20255.1 hypothetical protein EV378_4206 [Pseudonocardia endophytica]
MTQTTPSGPRHARFEELEPPTTAIPTVVPGEFTDDSTQVIPVIPVQRTSSPGHAPVPRVYPVPDVFPPLQPAGLHPVATVPTTPKARRRILPAVLAGMTALLLAAGVAVGVTGATSADLTGSSISGTP